MGKFEFSAGVDANNIFLVNHTELHGRLDPLFYKTVHGFSIARNTIYGVKKLSEVIAMQRGRFGHRPRNDPKFYDGQYPFMQTGDVVKASQTNEPITYTQTLNDLGLKTSRLFDRKVLVITIAANIGDTAILDYPACFPDSLIGLTPKDGTLTLDYLNIYFKFLKPYLEDIAPQAAQKNINYQQLSPVPIVVPPPDVQAKIADLFKDAHHQKHKKEKKAQALLDGIDAYLLAELGITLPEQDNRLEKRIFTVPHSSVSGRRLDAFYNLNYFRKVAAAILKSKHNCVKLGKVLAFIDSGSRPQGGVGNISEGILSLGGGHVNTNYEIDTSKPKYITHEFHDDHKTSMTQLLDVLIVKDGATTGKVGIIENAEHVGQNINEHLFILRPISLLTPHFLVYFLHTTISQQQIQREITGATVTGLTKEALKNILMLIPPIEKQNEIAAHISDIRAQAKQLQEEAAQILATAKTEIERMIVGETA